MKSIVFYLAFMALLGSTVPVFAKITLPAFFSDGMVLQQKSHVKLWGNTNSKNLITIQSSWDKKSYYAKPGDNGSWNAVLKTPSAGGPFSITISDGETSTLKNILIGEVWLASGQSNMKMPIKGFEGQPVQNSDSIINESPNNQIRFFIIKNNAWRKPLSNCEGEWQESTPQTRPAFSATAYLYAKQLQNKLKVPVGVIEADWGGTFIQPWMNRTTLTAISPETKIPADIDSANVAKNTPCGLFNAMINPIVGYRIKGVIWYQGEQNRPEPALYARLFPAMVKQWRDNWGQGDFPFFYVQIAPFLSKKEEPNKEEAAVNPFVPFLREAQLKDLTLIPNAGMAVLTDVGTEHVIHPPDKQTVAKRLAALALAKTYGFKGIACEGPQYNNYKINGNKVTLFFKRAEKGLHLRSDKEENFEVAGIDGIFHTAKPVIDGTKIIVSSDLVKKPVAARYGFHAWVHGNLYNAQGLPASSFRTDDWPLPSNNP